MGSPFGGNKWAFLEGNASESLNVLLCSLRRIDPRLPALAGLTVQQGEGIRIREYRIGRGPKRDPPPKKRHCKSGQNWTLLLSSGFRNLIPLFLQKRRAAEKRRFYNRKMLSDNAFFCFFTATRITLFLRTWRGGGSLSEFSALGEKTLTCGLH